MIRRSFLLSILVVGSVAPMADADARRSRSQSRRRSPSRSDRSYGGYDAGGRGSYYPHCASARAAGAASIIAGKPGYARKLDRNGDGVACG